MPISVTCHCGKTLHIDEKYRGKNAKCPVCGDYVRVESETAVQAEAPRPRIPEETRKPLQRPQAANQQSMMLWIAGGGCGLLALFGCLLCSGGGGWMFYARAEKARVEEARVVEQQKVLQRRGDRVHSANNLKQIALAMHCHHDDYKRIPSYATVHPQTQQLHLSWRVLILPFIEEQQLYRQIRLDEPWDSAHNRQFWNRMPKVYAMPGKPSEDKTCYQVFFGDGAGFRPALNGEPPRPIDIGAGVFGLNTRPFTLVHITDGTSNTIFAVEAAQAVNWMKPQDIPFQIRPEGTPTHSLGGHWGDDTFQAAMFDGAVRRFRRSIAPLDLQNLVCTDDNNVVNLGRWEVDNW